MPGMWGVCKGPDQPRQCVGRAQGVQCTDEFRVEAPKLGLGPFAARMRPEGPEAEGTLCGTYLPAGDGVIPPVLFGQ